MPYCSIVYLMCINCIHLGELTVVIKRGLNDNIQHANYSHGFIICVIVLLMYYWSPHDQLSLSLIY